MCLPLEVLSPGLWLQVPWHCAWLGNGQAGANAVGPGRLPHLLDAVSGKRVLVDTSATFSVFPHKSTPACPAALNLLGLQDCIFLSFVFFLL